MAALALGGAQVVGGLLGKKGKKKAAKAQAAAAAEAARLQAQRYAEAQAAYAPYMQAGLPGLNNLTRLAQGDQSAFTADPGYQFRLGQGLQSLDRQAAARSGRISGAAMKAAQRYGQDFASNEYGNVWNRNLQLAGIGQNAVSGLAGLGQASANAQGNAIMGQGAAKAAGYEGAYGALGQTLSGLAGIYAYNKMGGFNPSPTPSSYGYGSYSPYGRTIDPRTYGNGPI